MRREVDISPEHLLTDNNPNNVRIVEVDDNDNVKVVEVADNDNVKVVNVEENQKTADKGNSAIIFFTTCALAALIIIGVTKLDKNKNIDINKNTNNDITTEQSINNTDTNKDEVKTEDKEDLVITTEKENKEVVINEVEKEVDYTNVESFYDHIIENRNIYGSFAESFQTEEDIKNFINFVYQFNDFYSKCDLTTTIESKEQFDNIVADYYSSCANKGITGQLSTLFESIPDYKNNLAESENLAADLKNGTGKDYTIANNYYTWFGKKLCDDRTAIDSTRANAPLIEILRWQYEQYRYAGNMLNARRYQKNDSLPIESYTIYYAEPAPEGVEVIETQNAFSCPDWGIDNVVSPTEEDTETKLVIKETADSLFYRVQESFKDITQKHKVRG